MAKISKLIEKLQKIQAQHGDILVVHDIPGDPFCYQLEEKKLPLNSIKVKQPKTAPRVMFDTL